MTELAEADGANVIAFRSQAQITKDTVHDVAVLFPGWKVWCTSTGTWNAHRRGEEPWFGPSAIVGRAFMVSAASAPEILAELEGQARIDVAVDFPGWRLRETSVGWAAFISAPCEDVGGALSRLVQRPTISGLRDALGALASRPSGYTA